MFSTNGFVSGIDLGSESVKLVRARASRAGTVLLGAAIEDLPPADPDNWEEESTRAVQKILKTHRLSRHDLGRVALAIGGASVHVRQVDLPSLTDTELRSSIRYEARKHLPLEHLSEASLDCQVISRQDTAQKISVLFAGAPEALVKSKVRVVQKAGLEPEIVEPAPLSLLNGVHALPSLPVTGTLAILDLGASGSTFVFWRSGGVVYSRTVSLALPDGESTTASPEAVDTYARGLATAYRETAQFYGTLNARRPVEAVFLAGGRALLEGLDRRLGDLLGLPVSPLDLTQSLDYSPGDSGALSPEEMKRAAPRLAVALGLLFWGSANVPD